MVVGLGKVCWGKEGSPAIHPWCEVVGRGDLPGGSSLALPRPGTGEGESCLPFSRKYGSGGREDGVK